MRPSRTHPPQGRSLCFRLGFFLRSGLFRLFRHFLILALGGVFRVQLFSYCGRFYRVRRGTPSEHANHQHQRQKQRKRSFLMSKFLSFLSFFRKDAQAAHFAEYFCAYRLNAAGLKMQRRLLPGA